jgi:hypothetical protein
MAANDPGNQSFDLVRVNLLMLKQLTDRPFDFLRIDVSGYAGEAICST